MTSLGTMAEFNVSEDLDYLVDLTTMVSGDVAEAATVSPVSPGRLLSVDYSLVAKKLSTPSSVATTTTAAVIDNAVQNVSVALCHPSNGIPSIDEYFTGEFFIRPNTYFVNRNLT